MDNSSVMSDCLAMNQNLCTRFWCRGSESIEIDSRIDFWWRGRWCEMERQSTPVIVNRMIRWRGGGGVRGDVAMVMTGDVDLVRRDE